MHDPRFDEFTIPSLDDFVGGERDELLLPPIRGLRKYLARMEQYCPAISGLFISVINHTYASASAKECRTLMVKAHEVCKVAMSLLFRRN